MPENESEEPSEGGLKGRLKSLEGSRQGPKSIEGSETMETEGEQEDPKQGAVNLLLEGKLSVGDIASQVGLPTSVVGGLKSQLLKKGYLQSEKPKEGPPQEAQKPSSPEDEMRQEMLSVLKEELSITPGIGEQGLAYILKRFSSDEDLGLDPNKLHFMIARHAPRMDDFDVKDVVERVFRVTETYHLDRLRGMRQFPGYRTGSRSNSGFPGYNSGPQAYSSFGPQEQRFYTDADIVGERRLWNIEKRQDELNSFLQKTNETLEKILEKTDKPSVPAESESIQKLGEKIEKLESELKLKEKEMDQKDKEALRNQISELRDELKGLRGSLNDFKSDEFRLIGTVLDKGVDFGKEILREAPASKAAQQIAAAMGYGTRPAEPPAEARESVLEALKKQGYTVPE